MAVVMNINSLTGEYDKVEFSHHFYLNSIFIIQLILLVLWNGWRFDMTRINIISYADDTVLLAENAVNIETFYIEHFLVRLKIWNLKLILLGPKSMLFRSTNLENLSKSMTLDNNCFEVVK